MSLIGQITLINQNIHIPSVLASDYVAREIISKEIQKLEAMEKEEKVKEIKEVDKIEKIPADDDVREDFEREIRHINLKV